MFHYKFDQLIVMITLFRPIKSSLLLSKFELITSSEIPVL